MFFTWNKLNRYEKDFIDSDTFDRDSDGVRAEIPFFGHYRVG